MKDLESMYAKASSRMESATADRGGYTNDPDGARSREVMAEYAERQNAMRENHAHTIGLYGIED